MGKKHWNEGAVIMVVSLKSFNELNSSYSKNLRVLPFHEEPFKSHFSNYLNSMIENKDKNEEFIKKVISDFLSKIFLDYEINVSNNIDLAIMDGKQNVQVMFEIKAPSNKSEMVSTESFNKKALQELVSYYMNERIINKNSGLKKCIITDGFEWYCIDAIEMDRLFFRNNRLYKLYSDFAKKRLSGNTTAYLYEQLEIIIEELLSDINLKVSYFNILDLQLKTNLSELNKKKLRDIYYFFSEANLLKKDIFTDSNILNKNFYNELLYIMGLEEEKGKKGGALIKRLSSSKRESGSLIENTIDRLRSKFKMSEEQYFEVGMQLSVLWINRLLFLKLLESQLMQFNNDVNMKFLDAEKINSFEDLYDLFFSILAKRINERSSSELDKNNRIPYLNSSLFEEADVELKYKVGIDTLRLSTIAYYKKTCLVDHNGKRKTGSVNFLEYLLNFLGTYNFSTALSHDKEEKNELINASVLGLIFEKINGYKDGSFFTPGKITTYMSKQTIRKYIYKKIKDEFSWPIEKLSDTNGYISSIDIANRIIQIIDNITICDPAVGSGHFLVSALNEIISIKSELNLLRDENGMPLSNYNIKVINDELIITDIYKENFKYSRFDKEKTRVQKAIFNEKKNIIERSLFGVDINPNSVNICRLRLWIELLKNAYYDENNELVTLPNIDINIRRGNSLVSRYKLDSAISTFTKKSMKVSDYLEVVHQYINTDNKDVKQEFKKSIENFKANYRVGIDTFDPLKRKLRKLEREYFSLSDTVELFELDDDESAGKNDRLYELEIEIENAQKKIKQIENNEVYIDAFEWRFEFPRILDEKGKFLGFDIILGNPPYVYRNAGMNVYQNYFKDNYNNNDGNFDLYKYFIELSVHLTKDNGMNCLITNSSFLQQTSFKKTRNFLLENSTIYEIYPLGPNAFDEATVDTVIYLIEKNKRDDYKIRVNIPENIGFGKDAYYISANRLSKNDDMRFDVFLTDQEHELIKSIRDKCMPIEQQFDVGVGINTGYIKSELTSDRQLSSKYHPMINGRGISYYGGVTLDGYIMYDPDFVKEQGKKGRTLPEERYFNRDKILVVRTRNLTLKQRVIATIDLNMGYNLNRLSNIIPKEATNVDSLYGLLGWINSSFFNWIFSKEIVDYEIKPVYLKKCPIKNIGREELVQKVKEALSTKRDSPHFVDICRKIDKLIYSELELTDEEIIAIDKYSVY